jgi:DNA-binding NarL/FixJ family response regulator
MYSKSTLISLLIIDDHPVVQEGLKSLLHDKPGIELSGSFTLGLEALAFLESNSVDVILLDISLPDINGIELCKRIKQLDKEVKILGLSNYSERSMIMQMLQNGANGYILKNASADELMQAIRQVLDNRIVLSQDVQKALASPVTKEFVNTPQLTRREKEILQLIADGLTTSEIASRLIISPLTVETHRKNLMQKFKVNNAAALIKAATDCALL